MKSKMMKKYILILGLSLVSLVSLANIVDPDSLVSYKGVILDKFSGRPLAGVSVLYKKLPYESEIGILTTNAAGEFEAYFRARESYSLQIRHEGYMSLSEIMFILVLARRFWVK